MRWWRRLRRLFQLLDVVEWTCMYCAARNDTPVLLWKQLRYQLLCRKCSYAQNYRDHIAVFDPDPPDHVLQDRAQKAS